MDQVARNLCDDGAGFLTGKRYLIHDRDPLFTTTFLATLAAGGVKSVKLPPRSPALSEFQKLRPKCDQSRLPAGDSRATSRLMTKLTLLVLGFAALLQGQNDSDRKFVSIGARVGVPITDAFETFRGNDSRYFTNTKRYLIGPTVEFRLPWRQSIGEDALVKR